MGGAVRFPMVVRCRFIDVADVAGHVGIDDVFNIEMLRGSHQHPLRLRHRRNVIQAEVEFGD